MDRLIAWLMFMQIALVVSVICAGSYGLVLLFSSAWLRTQVSVLMERMDEQYADHMEAHSLGWDQYIHGWDLAQFLARWWRNPVWAAGVTWDVATTNWHVAMYRIEREAFYWRYQVVHHAWKATHRKFFSSL